MIHQGTKLSILLAVAAALGLAGVESATAVQNQQAGEKKPAAANIPAAPTDLNQLSLEVSALQRLYYFEFTPSQLQTLAGMAAETMQKPRPRQAAKASQKFHKGLSDLRDALVKSNDDVVFDLAEKLDDLAESENPTLDDGVDVTEPARQRAEVVFKMLSVRQVAAYVANTPDSFADPVEVLMDALDQGRTLKANERKELRDDTIGDVGQLLTGSNVRAARKIHSQVAALLDKGYKLSADDFKTQRADLEKEAHAIAGDGAAMKVMHNVIDRDLAELLANPRFAAAIEIRIKTIKP